MVSTAVDVRSRDHFFNHCMWISLLELLQHPSPSTVLASLVLLHFTHAYTSLVSEPDPRKNFHGMEHCTDITTLQHLITNCILLELDELYTHW